MSIMEHIDNKRMYNEVEAVIRDRMLEVFDENEVASDFRSEEYFQENYLWSPDRWPADVRTKVAEVTYYYEDKP